MGYYYKLVTAKAPVNIALIKYWGKRIEDLKIPINDSLSGTLNLEDLCATTSVTISSDFESDELWLNDKKQSLSCSSNAKLLLDEIRRLSTLDAKILDCKVHIVSHNNFPTAAGLASSAAGYACLAFVLGHAYGITDPTELSKIARQGSGSACRSLFGGFVQWARGTDHETSQAIQIVDHEHWPEMRVIICVVNDKQKDVSSSEGMLRTVQTSSLIDFRAKSIVPQRIDLIKAAIYEKDFDSFADLVMRDSNQFHALCLDTYPPLFYLNDTSRQIIKICTIINQHYKRNRVAYTFDAGPNACIYLMAEFVPFFIAIMLRFFKSKEENETVRELQVKGKPYAVCIDDQEVELICNKLNTAGIEATTDSISYLIHTSIGSGPRLVYEHSTSESQALNYSDQSA